MGQPGAFHDQFPFGEIAYIVADNYFPVPFLHPDQLIELVKMKRMIEIGSDNLFYEYSLFPHDIGIYDKFCFHLDIMFFLLRITLLPLTFFWGSVKLPFPFKIR